MQYKVIVNPAAGRGDVSKYAAQLKTLLGQSKLDFDLVITKSPGQAIELAREAARNFEAVVAVGGDGTVNEVINGIMGTGAALGIIPAGTGNDIARTLGIPFDLEKAARALFNPGTVTIDIGKDIDGYFACILGIGFPSDVMHHANTSNSRFRGPTAIKASIIQVVNKLQPYNVVIEADGEPFSAAVMGIFILNTRYTGGGVQVAPDAVYDDGLLDVVIMHEMGKLEFLNILPKAFSGKHIGHPKVQVIRAEKIRITTAEPLRKDFDGNIYGTTPVDAVVLPKALKVLVPSLNGNEVS